MKKPAWLIKLETPFNTLFTTNVPHVLEKIFLSLDYETYKECMDVCEWWRALLKSASLAKRAKARLKYQIMDDQVILAHATTHEEVKRLVSSGMLDLNHCGHGFWGTTPLCNASQNDRLSVVATLIKLGAEVDRPDTNGKTPLYWAAFNGHVVAAQLLHDAGAQLNKANGNLVPFAGVRPPRVAHFGWAGSRMVPQQGSSPLHAAASRGHLEMVSILLEWGAGGRFNRHFGWP